MKRVLMLVGGFCRRLRGHGPPAKSCKPSDIRWTRCAPEKKPGDFVATAIHDFEGHQTYSEKPGHRFAITGDFDSAAEDNYDALVIPGGRAPEYLRTDQRVLDLVRAFDLVKKPIAAICHGPQILAAAGVLADHACSCYPAVSYEVNAAGGQYVEPSPGLDSAHTSGHLVTAPAWPAHPAWMRAFLELLDATSA